ncbi:uncharacterized protein Aud_005796 [Aspergillus udagawae]|uniref:Uncharacterized protein n=1 Tax=Aspergillus udagawae TaxID=91492 RepID=A0A8E0UZD2_9EURO|nr:uncharacterized protein Aud_005796 [Aspergillus udagawae]GIC89383.1 hypothetical protein Aud_005796 [Aspergillus udagawae]
MAAHTHALPNLSQFAPRTGVIDTSCESQPIRPNDGLQPSTKSKRRRRLSTTEDQPAKDRIFFFVDSNSSSREKRAYVMRHHVQEKRKLRKHLHPHDSDDRRNNRPLRYLPWKQKPNEKDDLDGTDAVRGIENETVSHGNALIQTRFSLPRPAFSASNTPLLTSPVTPLDASRQDPFHSLPMVCSKDDLDLIDCWTNKLTYWSGQNKYIKDQIFRSAMVHPLPFQAVVLGYCSRWKAHIYNLRDSRQVRTHIGQATRKIEMIRKGSMDIDGDNLAMALTGLSLQEERFGRQQKAREYADQAVQILRSQGGTRKGVQVFLHYVLYVAISPHPTVDKVGQRWLLTFLRAAEEMMHKHTSAAFLSSAPLRREAFQMDGLLFPLLSSGPRPSQVPQTSRLYVVRDTPSQEICRTAALIYITAALWDFQDSPSKTSRFLNYINTVVKQHQLDRYPACETLVWLLLEEGYESDMRDPERAWSTGELLKTHKQLRPDLQFQFNEILLSLLMLTPPVRGIDAFEEELNAAAPEIVEQL